MDYISILRELKRHPVLVVVGATLAIVVGLLLAYRVSPFPPKLESRKYEVGVATARVLVDTPNSVVVEVSPKGSETLGSRANLLSNLMAEGALKTEIAERAGLPPKQLVAVAESQTGPQAGGNDGASIDARSYVLTTRVLTNTAGDQLPIIELESQAPDSAQAAELADAGVSGLQEYLDSKAAGEEDVTAARRLRVTGLGPAQAATETRGAGGLIALAAGLLLFAAFCAAILLFAALVRAWRQAAQEDQTDYDVIDLDRLFEDEPFDDARDPVVGHALAEEDQPSELDTEARIKRVG